jgi:Family of unknown function (DUF5719)
MTTTPRTARVRPERRRTVVLVAVVAALGVLGVVSVSSSTSAPLATPVSAAAVSVGTESSAAFCGGLEHEAGVVASDVAIADLAGIPRTLEVTTSNDRGRAARRLLAVRPGHVLHLDPSRLLAGAVDAMTIVADGGGIAATESVSGAGGTAVAPCLTASGQSWVLTGGSTKVGHSLSVSVFNPTATSAQVTVSFLTPSGFVEPTKYKGLDLGPHQLVVLRVVDVAPKESPITTDVVTTSGNVVAYAVDRSTSGAGFVALLPGAPAPALGATFALTPNFSGETSKLVLANLGSASVSATVRTTFASGCGAHCAAPVSVSVAPGTTMPLQVAPTSRAPIGEVVATELTATAPGLVVVQSVRTASSLGQSAPLDDPGTRGATDLVLVDPTRSRFDHVAMANPSGTAVSVTLESVGPHGLVVGRTVSIAPYGVTVVSSRHLGRLVGGVLELVASGPIYATGEVTDALLGSDLLAAVPVV